jgi:hypothetical protein
LVLATDVVVLCCIIQLSLLIAPHLPFLLLGGDTGTLYETLQLQVRQWRYNDVRFPSQQQAAGYQVRLGRRDVTPVSAP